MLAVLPPSSLLNLRTSGTRAEGDEAVVFRIRGMIVGDGDVDFATSNAVWASFPSRRSNVGIHQRQLDAIGADDGARRKCVTNRNWCSSCFVNRQARGIASGAGGFVVGLNQLRNGSNCFFIETVEAVIRHFEVGI